MLMAVLGRRGRVPTGTVDVYASAVGGAKLTEPGVDLGLCLAVASAVADVPLPADIAMFGEVGLGGEIRQVGQAQRRMTEAARLGFRRLVVPASSPEPDADVADRIRLTRVATISQALTACGLTGTDSSLRVVGTPA